MEARVYVLLNTVDNCTDQVLETLRGRPGILMADRLEGPHDVMIVMEAPDRAKLAERMVRALAQVESMTEDLTLLPAETGYVRPAFACHKG
ncbi:MAG: hypothetical protein HYX84_00545 [Chloroflexi bacterium]|nr:hypothetical protein [Chloroflexota bacterium]